MITSHLFFTPLIKSQRGLITAHHSKRSQHNHSRPVRAERQICLPRSLGLTGLGVTVVREEALTAREGERGKETKEIRTTFLADSALYPVTTR